MKILVIGGSYFFGRWFVQEAFKEHDITVLNRGTVKVSLPGVREIACDRHDLEGLKAPGLLGDEYEVIVDFCAYDKGDISTILECVNKQALKKYIFISTVDVYERSAEGLITEDRPPTQEHFPGPEGAYIAGKVSLEGELLEECGKYGIRPVSVRPAVLYGPLNYAPRESIYFDWIEKAGQILHPVDADGHWQMIYVEDAAEALKKLCELNEGILTAYNFCTKEIMTYDSFEAALRECGCVYTRVDISVSDVIQRGIPLPFPLTGKESCTYSSAAYEGLISEHTPIERGLKRCRELR